MDDCLAGAEFHVPLVAGISLLVTYFGLLAGLILLLIVREPKRHAAPITEARRAA